MDSMSDTTLHYRTKPRIGATFGKLTLKKRAPAPKRVTSKTAKSYWLCECDCGKTLKVRSDILLGGKKITCGHPVDPFKWPDELQGPDVGEYSDRKKHHLSKKQEFE